MTRLRVGLLVNPTADRGGATRPGRETAQLLEIAGISTVDVSGPDASTARARALAVRDQLTALVVVGGDGTVSLGAEIVAGTPVRLGIVPSGSGNDLARALGIPVSTADVAVSHMLDRLYRPVTRVDALSIATADPDVEPRVSLALGAVSLGFDAAVNARANARPHRIAGPYTLAALHEVRSLAPFRYRLRADDGSVSDVDASILTIANGGYIGGGMNIVPAARMDDGLLDIAWADPVSRRRLLRLLPTVYSGAHQYAPEFHSVRARRVTVWPRDPARALAYADGEERSRPPLDIEVVPGAVAVLTDAEAAPGLGGSSLLDGGGGAA